VGHSALRWLSVSLNGAMAEEMEADDRVYVMGEEVGEYQGAYKVRGTFSDEKVANRDTKVWHGDLMMDESKTPRHDCRSCRYLSLRRGVWICPSPKPYYHDSQLFHRCMTHLRNPQPPRSAPPRHDLVSTRPSAEQLTPEFQTKRSVDVKRDEWALGMRHNLCSRLRTMGSYRIGK
jgi:hypothetical protein